MLSTELGSQAGISIILVYLLQWLKGSPWFPWLTARTDTINRTLAIVNMTGSWTSGGTLIIQIPAATAIFSVILHSAAQVGMQEGFYRMAVKPPPEPLLKLSKDDTVSVTKG
jgi:hypothetical protein